MNHLGFVLLLWLAPLRSEEMPALANAAIARAAGAEVSVLQDVTDDLRVRLDIAQQVQVDLVDHNPLVMSVETLGGRGGPFVITIDRAFVRELNAHETAAAIAHELGHVWIYTHEPFQQSERLANDIAMRVIKRSAFEPVYAKVWKRTGVAGNLIDFIGPPSQQ